MEKKQLNLIKDYFENLPIKRAYLFGSYARNEATIYSDIDILVELDFNSRLGTILNQASEDLEVILSKKVDIVLDIGISEYFKEKVKSEKFLIYQK